ncbi:cytochrome P450 [Saccharothrix texasensis]|uniref:Cytochrome P450 n=1 Tax=Saccharothrix texasensis TaxID=103734 RepID=A0A3N1GXK5_9PSEU|nr:cytochrome P450 [Saccharothrix texasensis]ROP34836.1 cytochrome P450 [Saccharothrix texasensis]
MELLALVQRLGPVASFPFKGEQVLLASSPEAVRHVLARHPDRYAKRSPRTRFLLGEGIIPASGESWLRQRRTLRPHFVPRALGRYEEAMRGATEDVARRWARSAALGRPRDIGTDLRRYSLDVIWRCLTGAAGDEATYRDLDTVNAVFNAVPALPGKNPELPPDVVAGIATVHGVVDRAIRDARHDDRVDLWLPMLLSTPGLDDRAVRDQVLNLVVAGYETTGHTLLWIFTLLDRHPRERDRVLAAGPPGSPARTAALRALVDEALRLYPVAWLLRRNALSDDVLCGYRVDAGTAVMMSPYLTQRDPALWPEPERFAPERFTGRRPARPGAYFPFGTGARACLGTQFAHRETAILLDRLLTDFDVRLHRVPEPVFGLTIHPDDALPATLTAASVT